MQIKRPVDNRYDLYNFETYAADWRKEMAYVLFVRFVYHQYISIC